MTLKLIQKRLFNGIQELELTDDCVNVRSKAPFKEAEAITIMLTVIDPEPVITKAGLNFRSRVNGETLLSLYLGKPNQEEFNAFANALKQKTLEAFNDFAGLTPATPPSTMTASDRDAPPEFEDSDEEHQAKVKKNVDPEKIGTAMEMLQAQMDPQEIALFLSALEKLKEKPANYQLLVDVLHAFNELGPKQGPVLAYAPYISILLSDSAVRGQ